MAEKENVTQSQGDDYIKLGYLLKKTREGQNAERVNAILNGDGSISEKIRQIEACDKEFLTTTDQISPQKIKQIIKRNNVVTEDVALKNLSRVKNKLKRVPWLFFLFGEFSKIRKFGKENGTINSRFILPKVMINQDVKYSVLYPLQKDAVGLLPVLDRVLSYAWQILEKHEYNLIVKFQQMCQMFAHAPVSSWAMTADSLLNRMEMIERWFLLFYSRPNMIQMLLHNVELIMRKIEEEAPQIKRADEMIKRLLLPDQYVPSLYQLLLAINMVHVRKYLTMEDLLNKNTPALIHDFQYECSEKVRLMIERYIRQKADLLSHFAQEKYEIDKVKLFLSPFLRGGDEGGYNYRLLSSFYSTVLDGEQIRFTEDRYKMAVFIPNFINLYFREFESFLTDKTDFQNSGEIRAFGAEYFSYEVARMHSFFEKILKELFYCPHLSTERFYALKSKIKSQQVMGSELVLVQLIDEIGEIIVEIGLKMSELLVHYHHPDEVPLETEIRPIDASYVMMRNAVIPFWNEPIIFDGIIARKTFKEAIHYIVSLSLLTGLFLENRKLQRLLSREQHVRRQWQDLNGILKRVADVVTYEKLKSMIPSGFIPQL